MYITNPDQASWLLEVPAFSVDIETDTEESGDAWKGKRGLSFVSDITWVSFYADGFAPVVFDLAHINPERPAIIEFIRKVFSRSGYTAIAHNAVFDLRSLGGQYGFKIPLGSKVWDTLTFAILLLMGEDFKGDISLKSLATRYSLFKDVEELEFLERMKSKRDALHLQESDDVMRYVVADTVITWRLYELQKAIIATSPDPTVEPFSSVTEGQFKIDIGTRQNRPRFLSTKRWTNLPELVEWEQRISRWCCNSAARGIKLDKTAVARHLKILADEFRAALDQVQADVDQALRPDKLNQLSLLIYYKRLMDHTYHGKPSPSVARWTYFKANEVYPLEIQGLSIYVKTDYGDPLEIADWLHNATPKHNIPQNEMYRDNPPVLDVVQWIVDNIMSEDGEWNCASEQDVYEKAKIIYEWYDAFFTRTTPIDPMKLANMKLFQPFYTFIVKNFPFPNNEDIARQPLLVTDKLAKMVEAGADLDFKAEVFANYGWSFSEDAIRTYWPDLSDEDPNWTDDPFVILLQHKAKMSRIDEFYRHTERDGRLHSIIARKTRTGRATSVTMNLQNIDVKTYKGYLVPDDDTRVLIGIDISNAENWILAMTFGDSGLAEACASGDFHSQMTSIYWPDFYRQLIAEERWDDLKALRRKSKAVTFGSAYGAGARKISRMIGTTPEEAKVLLANRDNRFMNYSQGRIKLTQRIEKCYRDGHRPAFTTLWSGRRVAIPMKETTRRFMREGKFVEERRVELAAYKATNYLPQGGVGEIIWRGIVLANEQFERDGIDAHICLQVHDEIIVDTPVDKAFEVASIIIKILASIVPQEFMNRTVPACRILSALGPENAKKWGFQYDRDYPLPKNKFVNEWGVFDMPEGEVEAPTWIGPFHQGYTLEREIAAAYQEPTDEAEGKDTTVELKPNDQWRQLEDLMTITRQTMTALSQYQNVSRLVIDGEDKGLFDFANRMLIQQDLAHKGYACGDEYWTVLNQIEQLEDNLKQIVQWKQSMGIR
jgi:DNA polymerase I-like protein with 3'-5' exonuclease and polymerase domains